MSDKKYEFTEKELAEALRMAWKRCNSLEGLPFSDWAKEVCKEKNITSPPTLGPNYLMQRGQWLDFRVMKKEISAYLDGLYDDYVQDGLHTKAITISEIRTALCGERKP